MLRDALLRNAPQHGAKSAVIAGLDPAIHQKEKPRRKPGFLFVHFPVKPDKHSNCIIARLLWDGLLYHCVQGQGNRRMGILKEHQVESVYHYAPLHYLTFIARSQSLRCKPSLKKDGFQDHHLRTKSRNIDVARGFGSYAHLTLHAQPNILKAKLQAGFPHISIVAPVNAVEATPFSLCRYNVAMARQLRINGQGGFEESDTNGRYYNGHQIPIAKDEGDMDSMLGHHLKIGTMIEVLIHGDLPLPDDTKIICYSKEDAKFAQQVLNEIGRPWKVTAVKPPSAYSRKAKYIESVKKFTKQALADPNWRGDGLEFDRFK